MKSITHWTPHYAVARGRVLLDQRLHPDHPWLTAQSVGLLAELLHKSDVALEFGSGRSTRWFAQRVRHITSVESDADWHKTGLERLKADGLGNVDLLLRPMDVPEAEGAKSAYVHVLDGFATGSLDFCLVDGMYRGVCALGTIPKLRAGGFLAIDNAGWFLPSSSRTPGARPLGSGGYDAYWDDFIEQTAHLDDKQRFRHCDILQEVIASMLLDTANIQYHFTILLFPRVNPELRAFSQIEALNTTRCQTAHRVYPSSRWQAYNIMGTLK